MTRRTLMWLIVGMASILGTSCARQDSVDQVAVLVAAEKIPPGTMIKEPEKMFKLKKFIKGEEPKGAISDPLQLKDKIANKTIQQDQFVTAEDLTTDTGPKLEKGQRAFAIRVDQDKVAGGFVMPNRRVDVIVTERKDKDQVIARTVLQNVLVLAVDQLLFPDEGKGARLPATVTLAVNDQQARALATAREKGTLSLALRAPDDRPVVQAPLKLLPGQRAMAVKTSMELAAGGFILPGSHVDVICTVRPTNAKPTARIILQNIEVLAVDSFIDPDEAATRAPNVITLAVTPEQAERLALGQDMGTIRLILRAAKDDASVKTSGVSDPFGEKPDGK